MRSAKRSTSIQEPPKYQVLLHQEMLDRKRLNPRYSARAMARDLGVSAAFFSQLMSGKRALSDETAADIAGRLKWTAGKRRAFLVLAQIARTKSPELKRSLTKEFFKASVPVRERKGFRRLNLDTFNLISDWYHFALLELTEVFDFKPDLDFIAKRLGVPADRIHEAVERLKRIGMLSPDFKKLDGDYRIGDIPSEAIRNFHRQMLRMAGIALERQPVDRRDFSGCTIAMDPKKLPQARELIRNFQKELMELMNGGDKSAVYQMSMQFFRLDRENR